MIAQRPGIKTESDLASLLDSPPVGTDADVLKLLHQIYETGAWVLLESAVADLPIDLRSLLETNTLTMTQLAALYVETGATTAVDLAAEVRRQSIQRVSGLDEGVESAVAAALSTLRSSARRVPLGYALALAAPILDKVRQLPGVAWAEVAGSPRRGRDSVGDIEIVAATIDARRALEALQTVPLGGRVLLRGARRLYLAVERVQIGVRLLPVEQAPTSLLHVTGHWRHVERLASLARDRGWSLDPHGLVRDDGARVAIATEQDIYDQLGLPWIPAEIREGLDEIDRAIEGTLPTLVTAADMRGDLHMHTHWSDGRDSIEAMVTAAQSLGYEYLAITDHSPGSAASRNLTLEGVAKQAAQIEQLRGRYRGLTILHGCEVDILPDGRLDFPDPILERFDIVLASLHEAGNDSPAELLRRYLAAMSHPLVAVITHPTNRLVPSRPGYALDYDRLFAAAVETGTALEIDGAPVHLDLDATLSRRAVEAGVTVVIDSDGHRADRLQPQMALGVLTARRGWVEARHVLNTRPVNELRAFVASKRAR